MGCSGGDDDNDDDQDLMVPQPPFFQPNPVFREREKLSFCRPFTVFTDGEQFESTVVQRLTPYVDQIRDIATRLGARPYRVALIWTQWSGGETGIGVEQVLREEFLLPTPMIGVLNTVKEELTSVGLEEVGELRVTEISPRYNEDYLMGRDDTGHQIPSDQNFYWEIAFPRPDGQKGVRRRFLPKSVPSYQGTNFEWTIDLVKAIENRDRDGDPQS